MNGGKHCHFEMTLTVKFVNMSDVNKLVSCPICTNNFPSKEIETHVNKCIFLNCAAVPEEKSKRKRTPSPNRKTIPNKSPRIATAKTTNTNQNIHTQAPSSSEDNLDTKKCDKISLNFSIPLAKQLQPKTLEDFFGQNHVLGENTVLRSLLEKGEIPNMLLWGPPGCGKTSLSSIIHEMCKNDSKKLKFVPLCAATCGVKEVQNIVTTAKNEKKFGRQTILFMDEIHRFNKRQQDTFLMCVEKGEIILIGATTENPSFSINNALLSRCRVIVMEKLQPENLYAILENAIEKLHIDLVDNENPCGIIKSDTYEQLNIKTA